MAFTLLLKLLLLLGLPDSKNKPMINWLFFIALFFCCIVGHTQAVYEPVYNSFYETEIETLQKLPETKGISLEIAELRNDWLNEISADRERLLKLGETSSSFKIIALEKLEKRILAELAGVEPELPNEEKKWVVIVDSSATKEITSKIDTTIIDTIQNNLIAERLKNLYENPIEGVYFRIQIAATTTKKTGIEVQRLLNIHEEVIEEVDGDMYKYLIGKFSKYTTARLKTEDLRKTTNIPAFVVPYKNDVRTTFQEVFKLE